MPRRRKRSPFSILLGTRFLVWGFAGLLLVLGAIMMVQGSIDTVRLRETIIAELKAKTGQEVKIKGKVSVRLLPRPVAFIPGIEITKAKNGVVVPELAADLVVLNLAPSTLLDEKPRITGIALQRPTLVLERGEDRYIQWGWINTSFIKSLFSEGDNGVAEGIKIVEGRLIFRDGKVDSEDELSINDIYLEGMIGKAPAFEGEASVAESIYQFSFNGEDNDAKMPQGAQRLNVSLATNAKNKATVKGYIDLSGDAPKIEGAFALESDNMRNWVSPGNEQNKTLSPVPLQFTGEWSQEGENIEIKDAQLQGLNSAGTGSVSLTWSDWHPNFQVDMHMKALDYDKWEDLLRDLVARKLAMTRPRAGSTYSADDQPQNPLPQDMHMLLYLDIENLVLGAQTLRQTQIQAALADGALTVNQFNIQMPGDAALTLFGVVSPANTGGLRFEGSMEMQGKSLRKMLTLVDDTAGELSEATFGDFSIRSNVFISSEQLRLSEAQAKLNDLQLTGGMVGYFDKVPRIEADVRLKDINFDYFRDVWRTTHKTPGNGDYFLKFDQGANYTWLKKLRASVDFRVAVDGFTFLEQQGDLASFRLFARENELGLYNVRLNYPTDELDANLTLDVRGEAPVFSVVLNTEKLDTAYFLPLEEEKTEEQQVEELKKSQETGPKKRIWSEELVDMSWLEGYGASYDLTINNLKHRDVTLTGLKFQGKLENSSLVFKNTSFGYWDGKCSMSGLLYGGRVPGLNLSFTLYNLQLQQFLRTLTGHETISGRMSITGTLATTGVNYHSWVTQADANMSLSGRSVTVDGLNLRGVVDAVRVSRTAADVFNNANLALRKGATDFSVDGTMNVKNGSIKSPGIALKSLTASGTLNAEVKLVPWKIDSAVLFTFQNLSPENAPTMTVQVTGPLESPQMLTDTASLEAYVAKQIIGH